MSEEKKEYDRVYRTKNKERYKKLHHDYYACHQAELKAKGEMYRVKRKYGLTLEQVDALLIKQDHRCAICGKSLKETKRVIDHNHKTGKVRGILCARCNSGLWSLEDHDFEYKARVYLVKEEL